MNINLLLLDANATDITCAVTAVIACIVSTIYTYFTYGILNKTNESLQTSQQALVLSNKSVEISNKLAKFQIYNEISKSLGSDNFYDLLIKCKEDTLDHIADRTLVVRHLLNPIEDLAKYYEDGFITIEDVDSGYGSTLCYLGESKVVNLIILKERERFGNVYTGFEALYHKVCEHCKIPIVYHS